MASPRARPTFAADEKKEPKQPRAAASDCFSAVPRQANDMEKLVCALLLNAPGVDVAKLQEWAGEVRAEAPRLAELGDAWAPASPADWATKQGAYGRLVLPMVLAVGRAGGAVHAQVATALKVLRLAGHRDTCTAKQIENYLYQKPREPGSSKKKASAGEVVRWYGRALVGVADLVWRHGPELRRAMRGEYDALPSMAEGSWSRRAPSSPSG